MKAWEPDEIKDLRKRLKLSQVDFGKQIGVSGNYVYLLEKGVKKPGKTLKLLLGRIEKEKGGEKKHGKGRL